MCNPEQSQVRVKAAILAALAAVVLSINLGCGPKRQATIAGIDSLSLEEGVAVLIESSEVGSTQLRVMRGDSFVSAEMAKIRVGETFQIGDGRHYTSSYRLVRINSGHAVFVHKSVFHATSLGDMSKSYRMLIAVPPYSH